MEGAARVGAAGLDVLRNSEAPVVGGLRLHAEAPVVGGLRPHSDLGINPSSSLSQVFQVPICQ